MQLLQTAPATPGLVADSHTKLDWQTRAIMGAPLVGATLLSKFALPPFGAQGFGLTLPVIAAALIFGLATRRLQFAWRRLFLFFLMISVLGMIQVLRGDFFSMSSVALMGALGLSYVFTGRTAAYDEERMLAFFRDLTFLIAAVGVLQAIALRIVGAGLAFPMEHFLPQELLTQGYNNVTPLFYGSQTYKANGVFLLEPSIFSQLTAIGLIAELSGKARLIRLGVYAAAMIASYSGTGILILAVVLPLYALLYRRWSLVFPAVVVIPLLVIFAEPLHLDFLMNRTSEFDQTGSSGFARFVGWRDLFADRLWDSPMHALFGNGAGSFLTGAVGYSAAQMSYSKIIFEFGVLGALLYFAFIFYCIFSSRAPLIVRVAVLVCYFLNGAYSPTVTGIALSLLMWPGGQERGADAPTKAASRLRAGLHAT